MSNNLSVSFSIHFKSIFWDWIVFSYSLIILLLQTHFSAMLLICLSDLRTPWIFKVTNLCHMYQETVSAYHPVADIHDCVQYSPDVHVHFLLWMFILFVFLFNCVCISGQGHPYPWIGGSSESLWQAFIHNMKSGFCPIQRYRLSKPTEILLLSVESQIKSTGVTWCWFSKELSLTDLDK